VSRFVKYGSSNIRVELDIETDEDRTRPVDDRIKDARLVPIAQDVAIARAAMVCEVMFHIAAIRSLQQAGGHGASALVECVKAYPQDRKGQDGHQAAHLLPGQVRVASRPVWELAATPHEQVTASDRDRLEARTEICFATTWVLPDIFNRADSQAEVMAGGEGLKRLFGEAVQLMWQRSRTSPDQPLAIDRLWVIAALERWFKAVNVCYTRAAEQKRLAHLTLLPTDPARAAGRLREHRVLATYANSLVIANVARFISAHASHLDTMYRFL